VQKRACFISRRRGWGGPGARQSDSLEGQSRIEAAKVVGITRHDNGALATCDQDDRCINHVGGAGAPAEDTGRFSEHLIERGDDGHRSLHESTQRRLRRLTVNGVHRFEDCR
jgi:hypothetical protein